MTLPLTLNAEPDEQLLRITEQRVPAFSHDFVPNLLRTKPDPDVESKFHALETKMSMVNHEVASVSMLVLSDDICIWYMRCSYKFCSHTFRN